MGDVPIGNVIAHMSDEELMALVPEGGYVSPWAASGPVAIGGRQLFLKRLPLTTLEAERPYSTQNHFHLPVYYSYGIGSAGFGAWRELGGHQMTTGRTGFPTLFHHRVMPRTVQLGELPWSDQEYVDYWNSNSNVGPYLAARRAADQELWLLLDHVPDMMHFWLIQNQDRVGEVLQQLFESVAVLRSLGVVHFDAHLGNVVTDGTRARLVDFGLVMADEYELSVTEKEFLARHRFYDYGVILGSLGLMLATALGTPMAPADQLAWAIDHIDDQPLNYQPQFREAFKRYRQAILYMVDLFNRIRRPGKQARFEEEVFLPLLTETGLPVS